MNQNKIFFLLIILSIILFFISLGVGKVEIPIKYFIQFYQLEDENLYKNLILNFRLPRTITAVLVGIALPISGLLLQELFKNPIADASVLGITSMASLGVAIAIFILSALGLEFLLNSPWLIIGAAFIGSFIALLCIISFAYRVKSIASLIILGFMITGLSGAIIALMQYFATNDKIRSFLVWGYGSLTGLSWEQIGIFSVFIGIGVLVSQFTLRGVSALLLGEKYAQSLGLNVKKIRLLILLSTSLLIASATAFTGPIGFIGLIIPHLCRSLLKTGNIKKLYNWTILSGIASMLLFTIITEIFPFGTMPINIITALVGTPIVISILLNNKFEIR